MIEDFLAGLTRPGETLGTAASCERREASLCPRIDIDPNIVLQCAAGQSGQPPVVLDIGAGYGMFSLAAAARGLQVVAFEAAPLSAAALEASIAFNGFGSRLRLQKAALGVRQEAICLDVSPSLNALEAEAVRRGYGSASATRESKECSQPAQRQNATQAVQAALPSGASTRLLAVAGRDRAKPQLSALPATAAENASHPACPTPQMA